MNHIAMNVVQGKNIWSIGEYYNWMLYTKNMTYSVERKLGILSVDMY